LKINGFSSRCREEGIRTLDTVTRILPFQGSSFNHSDTSLSGMANLEEFFEKITLVTIFSLKSLYLQLLVMRLNIKNQRQSIYFLFVFFLLLSNVRAQINTEFLLDKNYGERQEFLVRYYYNNEPLRNDSVAFFKEIEKIKELGKNHKDQELILESNYMKLNFLSSRKYRNYLPEINDLIYQADRLKIKQLQVRARQALGFHYYYELNDYGKAIFHFLKSYEYLEDIKESEFPEKQEALLNIANICYNVGFETKALFYLEEAEKYHYTYDEGLKYNIKNTKALIYSKLGNTDKAISIHNTVYNSTKNTRFEEWNIISSNDIAKLYFNQNKIDKAKTYLDDLIVPHLERFPCENQKRHIMYARVYLHQHNYNQFNTEIEKLIPMYERGEICQPSMIDFLTILYTYYKTKTDYHNTLIIADKLLRTIKESDMTIQSNEVKIAVEQNNFEILQQKEKELNRSKYITYLLNFFYVALIVLAVVLFFVFYRKKQEANRKRLIENQTMLIKKEQEILQANQYLEKFKTDIIEKNKIIDQMTVKMQHANSPNFETDTESLSKLVILTEDDWQRFKKEFTILNPEFFEVLTGVAPNITPALIRLAALMYLGFNNQQISNTLGISRDSVARTNRRLKNILNVPKDEDFVDWYKRNH
jgi:tetratricopeptide (TPR) repeat protein/DNA-binding CsgD family transcriptional regulator/large-conductance mechanosensitive channel